MLDSSFVLSTSIRIQEPQAGFVSWGRDVDYGTTGRLFRNFNIIDLIWNSTTWIPSIQLWGVRAETYRTFNLSLVKTEETLNITRNCNI